MTSSTRKPTQETEVSILPFYASKLLTACHAFQYRMSNTISSNYKSYTVISVGMSRMATCCESAPDSSYFVQFICCFVLLLLFFSPDPWVGILNFIGLIPILYIIRT